MRTTVLLALVLAGCGEDPPPGTCDPLTADLGSDAPLPMFCCDGYVDGERLGGSPTELQASLVGQALAGSGYTTCDLETCVSENMCTPSEKCAALQAVLFDNAVDGPNKLLCEPASCDDSFDCPKGFCNDLGFCVKSDQPNFCKTADDCPGQLCDLGSGACYPDDTPCPPHSDGAALCACDAGYIDCSVDRPSSHPSGLTCCVDDATTM